MSNVSKQKSDVLLYTGSNFFRQRIVLATLFRQSICIQDIRNSTIASGIKPYEASLLRLIDKITNGSNFYIDATGTELQFNPGCLVGGEDICHDCGSERNITYFLEALLLLAPFCKYHLDIRLRGVTNGCLSHDNGKESLDPSVDLFKSILLPFMKRIDSEFENIKLEIIKRDFVSSNKGEVRFYCPVVQKINPIQLSEQGRIKRIRGVAVTQHVSSQFAIRMIDRIRWSLNDILPDVWVYHILSKNQDSTLPGYGVTLVAETMKGYVKGVDVFYNKSVQEMYQTCVEKEKSKKKSLTVKSEAILTTENEQKNDAFNSKKIEENLLKDFSLQEFMGVLASQRLLMQIHLGGVIGTTFQYIPMLFMALAEEHQVCEIKISHLTPYTIQFLRHISDFCSVKFAVNELKCKEEELSTTDNNSDDASCASDHVHSVLPEQQEYLLKCVGIGYKNNVKPAF
ncbi:RNA 3'-terminal phosphate cyclase-like protein [Hylaeus volcanicus]|uniref:RNA 3'-terminal phosphate cyclase-like protein n=1 Tax=Hylaeus volcanicus TaxID=313075 RepID=UPI0023B81EA5|nr:RNA 3'-terminal phosphate cyclase-like protein [Hylaeus volcanicus]XP_053993157.1 RNA 3'-terminal phosphate cyclase-like protein [Hylaeus volcanicus]XP_053993158.1 RNA 3'-terminal phosphate cyclase-like protein [Hylaeus volcanicus]XP_053993159.1 RNA 3'-terminal phosphate cyclase-like protein [Hylaeus volcanicus]